MKDKGIKVQEAIRTPNICEDKKNKPLKTHIKDKLSTCSQNF